MIVFKSCPKCHTGDLVRREDMDGPSLYCLQCGFATVLWLPRGLTSTTGEERDDQPREAEECTG